MADRRRQIELLIATRFDLLWFPSGQTFDKAAGATKRAGGRPGRLKPCERCGGIGDGLVVRNVAGAGKIRDRFGREVPCPDCNGAGRIPWDDYTGEAVTTAAGDPSMAELLDRDTRRVTCPDCQDLAGNATGQIRGNQCRRCKGTGEAPVAGSWLSTQQPAEVDGVHAPLEAAIDRRNRAGSYHELDVALAGISRHVNKPLEFQVLTDHARVALRLLDDLYLPPTTREIGELRSFELALVSLAFRYLDTRMPDPIRVPADVIANDRARLEQLRVARGRGTDERARRVRDEQARRWAREGKPYPWIGQQLGLSDRQLREIINGSKARA